jgi:transposase
VLRGRDVDEVVELKRQGLSIRAISRLTGYDRTTISRYLARRQAVRRMVRGFRSRASWNLSRPI